MESCFCLVETYNLQTHSCHSYLHNFVHERLSYIYIQFVHYYRVYMFHHFHKHLVRMDSFLKQIYWNIISVLFQIAVLHYFHSFDSSSCFTKMNSITDAYFFFWWMISRTALLQNIYEELLPNKNIWNAREVICTLKLEGLKLEKRNQTRVFQVWKRLNSQCRQEFEKCVLI